MNDFKKKIDDLIEQRDYIRSRLPDLETKAKDSYNSFRHVVRNKLNYYDVYNDWHIDVVQGNCAETIKHLTGYSNLQRNIIDDSRQITNLNHIIDMFNDSLKRHKGESNE